MVRLVDYEPVDEACIARGDRGGSITLPIRLENTPARARMMSDGLAS